MHKINFNNNLTAREIYELIEKTVEQKITEMGYPQYLIGTVTNVGSGTADVQLPTGASPIVGLKNKTGEVLNINDEVYILLIRGSLNNAIIDIKK